MNIKPRVRRDIKRAFFDMAKINAATFSAEAFGKTYSFECWSYIGKGGLTHACKDDEGRTTRKVWINRSWEEFEFQAVLKMAFQKYPADVRTSLEEQILVRRREAEIKKADEQLAEFQEAYDRLSPENKEMMREYPLLQSEEDVQRCMGFMKVLALFQQI